MSAILRSKSVGPWPMNTYVVIDPETNACAIIDPGADAEAILAPTPKPFWPWPVTPKSRKSS